MKRFKSNKYACPTLYPVVPQSTPFSDEDRTLFDVTTEIQLHFLYKILVCLLNKNHKHINM